MIARPLPLLASVLLAACAEGSALSSGRVADAGPDGTTLPGRDGSTTNAPPRSGDGAASVQDGTSGPVDFCRDGVRNGAEEQVDCGGTECPPCPDPGYTQFATPPANFDPTALDPAGASESTALDCGTATFDTDTLAFDDWCGKSALPVEIATQTDGTELAVLTLGNFEVAEGTTVTFRGSRPIVLAVFGDVAIAGTLDVSSGGAGSGLGCGDAERGEAGTGSCGGGGSGGGGGGLGQSGGGGGRGGTANRPVGGQAWATETLSPLVGGCAGGRGGGCDEENGGAGGGALQLSAAGNLTVTGSILARGADGGGGGCGCSESGGGGGGSGGTVLLQADSISIGATANIDVGGGAGGAGRGGGASGSGGDGQAAPGNGGASTNGGGGGGGGAGRIRVEAATPCTSEGTLSGVVSQSC